MNRGHRRIEEIQAHIEFYYNQMMMQSVNNATAISSVPSSPQAPIGLRPRHLDLENSPITNLDNPHLGTLSNATTGNLLQVVRRRRLERSQHLAGLTNYAQATANSFNEMYQERQLETPAGENSVAVEALNYRGVIDPSYFCPISGQIMTHPVFHPSNPDQHFEKAFIQKSLEYKEQNPLNRQPMRLNELQIDAAKKLEIDRFVQDLSKWLTLQRETNKQIPSATLKPIRFSQVVQNDGYGNNLVIKGSSLKMIKGS